MQYDIKYVGRRKKAMRFFYELLVGMYYQLRIEQVESAGIMSITPSCFLGAAKWLKPLVCGSQDRVKAPGL